MSVRDFVVGLGANLGAREDQLRQAISQIAGHGSISAVSGLFETAAVGPPQPDFLNAAVRVACALEPQALLHALLGIELALGRVRQERWGPRMIDLDLLWSPGLVLSEAGLQLPHPLLHERPFALVPLLEVVPLAAEPTSRRLYRDILADLAAPPLSPLAGTQFGAWIR